MNMLIAISIQFIIIMFCSCIFMVEKIFCSDFTILLKVYLYVLNFFFFGLFSYTGFVVLEFICDLLIGDYSVLL